MLLRRAHLAVFGACAILASCASSGNGANGESESALPQSLVAVWVIDQEATLARAGEASTAESGKPLDVVTRMRLKDDLRLLDTQLGLNPDGTFILKNRQRDGHEIVTVEGNWSAKGSNVTLTALRENGQPAASKNRVVYTVEKGRLVRTGKEEGVVFPVFKKGLMP